MRGFIGLFVGLVILLIVGAGAYQLGVTQGAAATGTAVAAPAVYYWHPFFFGGFGFLFPLLFLFLIFFLIRGAFWGWGRGYGGPGRYGLGDRQAMLEDWHKRAHGETPRTDGGSSAQTPPTGR